MADLPDDTCRMFYVWLLAKCDAWGRLDARPRKLNVSVWPLLGKSDAETARCLEALRVAGLVEVYWPQGHDPFLQVPDWEEKAGSIGRKSHRSPSQHPDPASVADCKLPGEAGGSGRSRALPGEAGHASSPLLSDIAPLSERAREADPVPAAPEPSESADPPKPKRPRKPATGPQADCIRHWESEWARTRLGAVWKWTARHASDVAKALDLAGGDAQEVQARATRLLESGDDWTATNASPALLVSRWNQLGVVVVPRGAMSHADRAIADFERMGGMFSDGSGNGRGQGPKSIGSGS